MPVISKIRLANIVYEDGFKRINDDLFLFDGHNGAIILENGGGKTVFIHTVLQAVWPHANLAERKIRETLQLENGPAHIGVEWIINDRPRRYVTTVVSLYLQNNTLQSLRYVFEYEENHPDRLEKMPFVLDDGERRYPAYRETLNEYYQNMKQKHMSARTFDTIHEYRDYLEKTYHIIKNEWQSIVTINGAEGGIERFFEDCRTTNDLYDRLLIPTVEQSIEGHEENMFADMFEKQRDSLKVYSDFKKSLAEYEEIQHQLDKYVNQFAKYHELEQQYITMQQKAKGLFEATVKEKNKIENELVNNVADLETWYKEETQLQMKKASYDILLKKNEAEKTQREYEQLDNEYEEANEALFKMRKQLYSLRYAFLVEQQTETKQLLTQYRNELETYDKEHEIADLESQLEVENSKLHGYFLTKIEEISNDKNKLELDKKKLEENSKQLNVQIEAKEKTKAENDHEKSKIEGQIEEIIESSERLKQELLANPEQQTVEEQVAYWIEAHRKLDEEKVRLINEHNDLERQLVHERNNLSLTENELKEIELHLSKLNYIAEEMKKAHETLVEKLVQVRLNWQDIDLHLRGETVRNTLEQIVEKLVREHNELLDKERYALRYIDDYGTQSSFFAEVFLAKKVTDWQDEFFIEYGPNYLNNFPKEERVRLIDYPFWSITLVTNKATKELLIEKINDIREEINHPVIVVSLEEVEQLHVHEIGDWIIPKHWIDNIDEKQFTLWKEQLSEVAKEATTLRKVKEDELTERKQLKNEFEAFFVKYPKQEKDQIEEESAQYKEKKRIKKYTIETIQKQINEMEETMKRISRTINESHEKLLRFEDLITKGTEYNNLQRRIRELKILLNEKNEFKNKITSEINYLLREYDEVREELLGTRDHVLELEIELRNLQKNERYLEVKEYPAKFTEETEKLIEEKRKKLQLEIQGIQQTYDGIKARIEHQEDKLKSLNAQMRDVQNDFPDLDTTYVFPINGAQLIERLQKEMRKQDELVTKINKARLTANDKLVRQKTIVETAEKDYINKYSSESIYEFTMNVAQINEYLISEEKKLSDKKKYLDAEKIRIEKQLDELETAYRQLDKYDLMHDFNSSLVNAIPLTDSEITEFFYARVRFTDNLMEQLEEALKIQHNGLMEVNNEKDKFIYFCRQEITDYKLKELAINGIDTRKNYEDVLKFQNNMLTTIREAEKYARNYISDKDREIQSFISQIHNHLYNVVEQLRLIPRNTRVNVDGVLKDIYQFKIPEWSEEEGKSRINGYLDWILGQLESERFKNIEGAEDKGKVRKQIEMWLDSKQLLRIVMDNQEMKVLCRKVTNDNKVSGRLTSWEQSNKWSGGEKWSKNMTLFLGILNFVAEKKQVNTKLKRRQAVILDNPFGKASSEHVLNPVFFIAEQLGFQIIALTAHADGKFLQDYFPINYSLRLRNAKDGRTQIMTKEKQLQKAYLRDHDPDSLQRLGESEQLRLF